jgi:murein DD-endopeptidase MepM/ murein hydrolase activator NlpD
VLALPTGSAVFAIAIALAAAPVCVGLGLPQGSDVVRPFGPTGEWSGHFGVDLASPFATSVAAAGTGTVSFVGSIAGRISVTINHGGRYALRTLTWVLRPLRSVRR